MSISAEDLLLGGDATHRIAVPPEVLSPAAEQDEPEAPRTVVVRPLRLIDVQRIRKAGQDSELLTSVLMIQQALVEPKLSLDQVNRLHAGVAQFLLREINRVSGLAMSPDDLHALVRAPLARACFVLAREFGWTPQACAELTLGQILLYLEMLGRGDAVSEEIAS